MPVWSTPHFGTGGELVARQLAELDIGCIFSVPGSQVLPIWDGLPRRRGPRLVVPRSERSAAFMAEGYGLAAGRPAALVSTLGPGVSNELVGVFSARESGAPVLCLAPYHLPEKRPRGREVFQGLDHPRFFDGAVKATHTVDREGYSTLADEIVAARELSLDLPTGPVRVDVSFALLFRRRVRGLQHHRRRPRTSRDRAILVTDAQRARSRPLPFGLADLDATVLSPGLAATGAALSFSVGVRLATPSRPVAVVTDSTSLLDNLDAIATARREGIEVTLVGGGERESRIARELGASLIGPGPAPRDETLTVAIDPSDRH